MEQRSEEWYAERAGKVTASRISDILAKRKSGGFSSMRENYKAQLANERWTGEPAEEMFQSKDMLRGAELEPQAVAVYEFYRNVDVAKIGFINHPSIPFAGCSPDGLVGDDGMIEVKCPNLNTHINTLMTREIDATYLNQMDFQMACSGRQWVDFVSYHPAVPEKARLFVKRIERNDERIAYIEREVQIFNGEVERLANRLKEMFP